MKTRNPTAWENDSLNLIDGHTQKCFITDFIVKDFRIKQYIKNPYSLLFLCMLDESLNNPIIWLSSKHIESLFDFLPDYGTKQNDKDAPKVFCLAWFENDTTHKLLPTLFNQSNPKQNTKNLKYIVIPENQTDLSKISKKNFDNCDWIKSKRLITH